MPTSIGGTIWTVKSLKFTNSYGKNEHYVGYGPLHSEATQYANPTNPHHYLVQHVVPIHQIHPSNITFFPCLRRGSTHSYVLEKRRKFPPFSFQQEVAEKQFELWKKGECY